MVIRISSSTPAVFSLRAASRNKRSVSSSVVSGLTADDRDLAQEFAGRVRGGMRRIEQDIGRITCAKFQAVATLQLLPLDPFPVHERSMFAAEIFEEKFLTLLHDLGVIAGDARVGDDQILVYFASHRERRTVQDDVFLLTALHKHKRRKHTGTGAMMAGRTNGIQGHGRVFCRDLHLRGKAAAHRFSDASRLLCPRSISQGAPASASCVRELRVRNA